MCVRTREHTWEDPRMYQIWTVTQTNLNDCLQETWKRCPIKVIPIATRVWLSDSESTPVSIHMYYIYFLFFPPLSKYLICFTTFCLCGNSFLQSQRARALSLTTGLLAIIWRAQGHNPASVSSGEPNPAASHCRPTPLKIRRKPHIFAIM